MNRRTFLRATGVAVGAGLAGCTGGTAQSGGDWDISMSASKFRPTSLTVDAGTTVTWRNTSKQGHTVTAYDVQIPDDAEYFASGGFASESEARTEYSNSSAGVLAAGKEYEYEFTVPGAYTYFCIPHERVEMIGTIVVEE